MHVNQTDGTCISFFQKLPVPMAVLYPNKLSCFSKPRRHYRFSYIHSTCDIHLLEYYDTCVVFMSMILNVQHLENKQMSTALQPYWGERGQSGGGGRGGLGDRSWTRASGGDQTG